MASTMLITQKMGFDLNIQAHLSVCQDTGRLFYYDRAFQKRYELTDLQVPQEHRHFLSMSGRHLVLYVEDLASRDYSSTHVSHFLEYFPAWEEIQDEELFQKYGWTEEDHNAFHAALEWLSRQDIMYHVTLSY